MNDHLGDRRRIINMFLVLIQI